MAWIVVKLMLTAALIVLVSELAKRSDRLGGLIGALPLVTVLTLVWMQFEHQPADKLANHARYTFWYVLPSLPMFLVFPLLLPRQGFWIALLSCLALTLACFVLLAVVLRRFGVDLWP